MPDAKKASAFSALSEGAVALEHELVERSWRARTKSGVRDFARVDQLSFWCADRTLEGGTMLIAEMSKPVRQTKRPRSQQNADAVREPFGEKENARFTVVPDVGANVEKFVGRDRSQKPFGPRATDPRTHS